MSNTLLALSEELAGAVARAAPSVVAVHARPRFSSSAVYWRPGIVVTAEHTVRSEDDIAVTLPDGRRVEATLAGRDPGTDLAVLKVEAGELTALRVAPEEAARPGSIVLVVGRSAETGPNATMGVISTVSGPWHTWRGGGLDRMVRFDATLYPGSSGGAVIDARGELLGLATGALSRLAGVAIPAATIDRTVDELLAKGHVSRGFLGVGVQPVHLPPHLKEHLHVAENTGVIVLAVEPGGPAERAGILIGDILVSLDGKAVASTDDLQAVLTGAAVGRTATALVVRGGTRMEVPVTIGERPRRGE